jgi:hypothetical protein
MEKKKKRSTQAAQMLPRFFYFSYILILFL